MGGCYRPRDGAVNAARISYHCSECLSFPELGRGSHVRQVVLRLNKVKHFTAHKCARCGNYAVSVRTVCMALFFFFVKVQMVASLCPPSIYEQKV